MPPPKMKTILLLGGMTPDVTVLYYNTINRVIRSRLGARHNAPLYMYSANLEAMLQHAGAGHWDSFAKVLTDPIAALTRPPLPHIDGVAVCAILAHKVTAQINEALRPSGTPLLHVADSVAAYVKTRYPSVRRLGLIGPKVTMTGAEDPDFFIGRLQSEQNGFEVLVPASEADMDEVNRGMLEEVAKGASAVTESTKAMFVRQARALVQRGAQGIVLGSTDLGFVIRQEDVGDDVHIIEPAAVHAEQIALWACQE